MPSNDGAFAHAKARALTEHDDVKCRAQPAINRRAGAAGMENYRRLSGSRLRAGDAFLDKVGMLHA